MPRKALAQTLANYEKAKELGLDIIPVINKIDLPSADVDAVMLEMMEIFHMPEKDIVTVSAKSGLHVDVLLERIHSAIRPPSGEDTAPLRALVFTSQFDQHKGVTAYVKVVEGVLTHNKLQLLASETSFLPVEIGVFTPAMTPIEQLRAGEVGYVCTGLKEVKKLTFGDTITTEMAPIKLTPLPGYKEPLAMVY